MFILPEFAVLLESSLTEKQQWPASGGQSGKNTTAAVAKNILFD
jgi:hypothetical protein